MFKCCGMGGRLSVCDFGFLCVNTQHKHSGIRVVTALMSHGCLVTCLCLVHSGDLGAYLHCEQHITQVSPVGVGVD